MLLLRYGWNDGTLQYTENKLPRKCKPDFVNILNVTEDELKNLKIQFQQDYIEGAFLLYEDRQDASVT